MWSCRYAKPMKHRGFTLIEFLFSAIIISALASLVLITAREASTTAQTNNIINDTANIRMAYSVLYEEGGIDIENRRDLFTTDSLMKYIADIPDKDKYELITENSGSWYVMRRIDDPSIKRKLAGHARSSGLLGGNGKDFSSLSAYSNQDYVIVQLR